MNPKTARLSQLCKLILGLALFLSLVPALRPAWAANPCAAYPQVCHYTWDPVERCCIADPKFDCFDVCFSSAASPADLWQADLALPDQHPAPQAVCVASDPLAAAQIAVLDFAQRGSRAQPVPAVSPAAENPENRLALPARRPATAAETPWYRLAP